VKSRLYLSGVLSHCVLLLSRAPRMPRGNWGAAATLAQLTSSCCVGVDPGRHSQAFHRLFLPSLMDGILSLASQLIRRAEGLSLFRKVMDSPPSLLIGHFIDGERSLSVHYEQIQMSEDVTVSLVCVQMWLQSCTASQRSLTSVSAGLDSLLDKDWRGRGFDPEVDQLIALIQSDTRRFPQVSLSRVRAACLIQAAWKSYQTRRRVKSLNRAVSTLQRRYRSRQQQQKEEQRWEEELKYQVCVRRQQARRKFHQKQRQLLQLLPPDQVQPYLQDCERRAAVVIQSFWRGFRERQRYNNNNNTLRHTHARQQAARTLQRAVHTLVFLLQQRSIRRAAMVPPTTSFWIGQNGLTDSRRAELKRQVEEHVSQHPSSRVSRQECERLHEEVQLLLLSELQRGGRQRREEQRVEALLAHTHTQLELLRDAPPLSVVTTTDADSFLSPSGPVAVRARDSHHAALQASRLPWWRTLKETAGGVDMFSPAHLQEREVTTTPGRKES
uniref:IQ motif containing B1 n=1 Tax=Cyclopterus lumpus TaxID=8103 RepID=A0A8C2WJD3_CYCLU